MISNIIAYLVAIVGGLFAGYANIEVDDPTLAALLTSIVAMALGLWKPKRPWRWALVVGFCVPAAQLLAYLKGVPPVHGEIARACFIGLVSAMVAAGLGSAGRFAFSHIQPPKKQDTAAEPAEDAAAAAGKRTHKSQS
jgi:hypothetical protein